MDEDAPSGSETFVADLDSTLAHYRTLARRTQNPAYAWLALEALFLSESKGSPIRQSDQEFTIPGWIADYLRAVVGNVTTLAWGIDFRAEPGLELGELVVTPEMTLELISQSEEFQAAIAKERITAKAAMDALPEALGLTRPAGWNAFKSLSAATAKINEFRSYQAMIAAGVPAKQANHAIASAVGVTDPSRMYARIREGQKLVADEEVVKPEG